MTLSSQSLIDAGRELEAPFEIALTLAGEVKTAQCVQLLRLVPGRRVVVKLLVDDQAYLAKIFLGANKAKYCQRERDGIEALQSANINTAKIKTEACLADAGADILLLDFLPDVQHLSEVVSENGAQGAGYLEQAVAMMATLHGKGLRHNDCHLDNFLISGEHLYLVDGDSVQAGAGLSQAEALENIALFFVQLPLNLNSRIPGLFASYCEKRGWSPETTGAAFEQECQRQRAIRQGRFLKKVFRDCTQFKVTKSWSKFVALDRQEVTSGLQEIVGNPDKYIETGKCLKDGNTATVALVEIRGKAFVVKRYNIKGVGHWLSRFWRPTRAWISWRNAQLLQCYGIGTPKPLAIVEQRFGPFRGKGYFIADYVAADSAMVVAKQSVDQPRVLVELAEQFAALFQAMELLRFTHGDFKASNFLCQEKGLSVIDLDSMSTHSQQSTFQKGLNKDQQRFMKNWGFSSTVASVMRNALESR